MKMLIRRFLSILKVVFLKKKYYSEKIRTEAFEPGHYYSVLPSIDNVLFLNGDIFLKNVELYGVNLNISKQIDLLSGFRKHFLDTPFEFNNLPRFNIENDSFSYDDAPVLHYFLRTIKPRRVIEIGSGNSSALMLDTNDIYLNNTIEEFTFIDIDLTNLKRVLVENDDSKYNLIELPIQKVDFSIFRNLKENDLVFVDTSHVSKIGSDLHTILFEILPNLQSGVYIHFHDIRYPFEYSEELIRSKVFWNEAYLLRAFLMFNNSFEICFWLNCLLNNSESNFDISFLPLNEWDRRFNKSKCDLKNAGGSIYLRKL